MSFRIAWKPYMYSQTLPHLLGGVRAPALVVWGRRRPRGAAGVRRALREALPKARLEVVEGAAATAWTWRSPSELAGLVTEFLDAE